MPLETDLDRLAARVANGAQVAIAKEPLDPVALVRAVLARGARDLHLVTVPTGSYLADLMIGAGAVATVETSGISLGEQGAAPRFNKAVREGRITLRDATCPAVYAALQAGEKGLPFMPMRGLIGSDLLEQRPDWRVIENPFADNDPIVALKAIRPDVALMHVPLADRHGNLWVGARAELKTLAHAAHATLATTEEIYDGNLMDDPWLAQNVVPAIYVEALAHVPRGAWPLACPKPGGGLYYEKDTAHIATYARIARDDDAFAAYIAAPVPEAAE